MANSLLIQHRNQVAKEKMQSILRELSAAYQSGEIRSPAELYHRVYARLQHFFLTIGRSTLVRVEASGAPYSADHNQMISAIHEDIMTLYREVQLITQDIQNNFQQAEMERESFSNRILQIENLVKTIDLNIRQTDYITVFKDGFSNSDQFLKKAVQLPAAHLSAEEGILTLGRVNSENFNDYATITIVEGNGFPGNTHLIRTSSHGLRFDGQEAMHIHLADILDGNADTWFEYEMIELTDKARQITLGMDFEYRESIEWASTGGPLKTVIRIELTKAKTMNWFSMTPFIPSDKGAVAAIIEQVVITDEKGNVNGVGFEESFDSSKGFIFPRQNCKTITIYLRQSVGYESMIGHLYFKQLNKNDMSVMDQRFEQQGVRVHGSLPSVENLGVVYDTGRQQVVYPVLKKGDVITDELQKRNRLFSIPSTPSNIQAGWEQVPAYRYVIGLRDVNLANYEFEIEGEYVSTPFISSSPLRTVELDVDVDVPASFDSGGDWLEYYISISNGRDWHRIYPRNVYLEEAKTKYLFNSGTQKNGRINECGYIDTLTDIYELQFRIILRRPEDIKDAAFYTPIVQGYQLYVTTAEELIP